MLKRIISGVMIVIVFLLLCIIPTTLSQTVIATIPVGDSPIGVGVNPDTNRIYVTNADDDTVAVIDGSTNTVITTIPVGHKPSGVGVNPNTNRIYVTNYHGDTVAVIDGSTNTVTATISVGDYPYALGVNPDTNRIYVTKPLDGTVAVIDGSTNAVITTISVGNGPYGVGVNPDTNRIYVTNADDGTVAVIFDGGCYYELSLSVGWNMVSFACLPDDPSFSSILSDVGYYQVLTWDGTSYVSPSTAEAGVGYWVLVLTDTTVTVANGVPVESYELDLPAGWSMIGSILPCTVDADCVFPSFYQLLTWDGTGYVTATTIEPRKGYWTLVLGPTHIVVDESCCAP